MTGGVKNYSTIQNQYYHDPEINPGCSFILSEE
jgi:hypothetical protein